MVELLNCFIICADPWAIGLDPVRGHTNRVEDADAFVAFTQTLAARPALPSERSYRKRVSRHTRRLIRIGTPMHHAVAQAMIRHLESFGFELEITTGAGWVRARAVGEDGQRYEARVSGTLYEAVGELAQLVGIELEDG